MVLELPLFLPRGEAPRAGFRAGSRLASAELPEAEVSWCSDLGCPARVAEAHFYGPGPLNGGHSPWLKREATFTVHEATFSN